MGLVLPAVGLLLVATFLPGVPVAAGPPVGTIHAGCFLYGWTPTAYVGIPTTVSDTATYVDVSGAGHPPPYDTIACDPGQCCATHWTSWADSCLGVPARTAVTGAWCGPAVGSTLSCIISGQVTNMPNHSNQFTLGFDVNWDGYVNEMDSSTGANAPLSTEPLGAGFGLPVMGISNPASFGHPPFPVGARMIAFPLASLTWGLTVPANFAIDCT